MKFRLIIIHLLIICLCSRGIAGKKYEPTWESLDSRETPEWYRDAKFGIFIHWGLYSVPAYAPKGTYAEWYWHAKDANRNQKDQAAVGRSSLTKEFHNRVYGEDFKYSDFRDMFTCEMFDPAHWAKTFKQAGAQYVVMVSKHHDGYCLWPNEEASESFGMPWNSVDSGPGRDLVGELTGAVRDQGIRMGLYYSIWDWFNPYWPENEQPRDGNELNPESLKKYVDKVMYPQFKEIVNQYQPAVIFSDGDWWMDDDKWQTRPLLAWLFNNAPNKDEVVINDRWGKVRKKHGGYFTTEYGSGFADPSILWEENRGIGKSFGYNRNETYDDYNTTQLLIFTLVDLVSRGGNFLLNIGPTADGRIPVIMEARLREMGEWLNVNSEAIFGTRRWIRDCQWSDGEIVEYTKRDHHHGVPSPIFEMTIMPREGQAVKEAYFTSKDDTVYAIVPGWPEGGYLEIDGIRTNQATKVSLLGSQKKVFWKSEGDSLLIDLGGFGVNDLPKVGVMYAFKIEHYEGIEKDS